MPTVASEGKATNTQENQWRQHDPGGPINQIPKQHTPQRRRATIVARKKVSKQKVVDAERKTYQHPTQKRQDPNQPTTLSHELCPFHPILFRDFLTSYY